MVKTVGDPPRHPGRRDGRAPEGSRRSKRQPQTTANKPADNVASVVSQRSLPSFVETSESRQDEPWMEQRLTTLHTGFNHSKLVLPVSSSYMDCG